MLGSLCNFLPVVATGIKPHTLFSLQLQSAYVVGKRGVECLSFSTHRKMFFEALLSFIDYVFSPIFMLLFILCHIGHWR